MPSNKRLERAGANVHANIAPSTSGRSAAMRYANY